MFEFAKKLTGIDLSGAVALPPWMLAVMLGVLAVGLAFVAMRGGTTDGNRYVDAAMAQGEADPLVGADTRGEQRVVHETIGLDAMLAIEKRTVER